MKKIILVLLLFVTQLFSQSSSIDYTDAQNAYLNGQFATAFKLFSKLSSQSNPDEQINASAKYFAADCLLNLEQTDGAVIYLEKIISQNLFSNFRPLAFYKLGTIYFYKKEYRKARDRFESLIAEYPKSENVGSSYYWIGEAYLAENKFLEAEEKFHLAISNKASNKFITNSIYSLAQLYEKTDDYKKAIESYDELLTYYNDSPLAPKSQLRIGVCYFLNNNFDNSILELTDPLLNKLSKEELAESKYFLSNAYIRLKEYKEANNILDELMKDSLDTNFSNRIYYSSAWVNFQQEKYDAAYNKFSMLANSAQDSIKILALYWSGESKRYLGDAKSADAIFKEFISKYPQHKLSSKAELGRGSAFLTTQNSENAESSLLNASLSQDVTVKSKAYTLLGELRLNSKKYAEAKKYFSESLRLTADQKELYKRAMLGMGAAHFYLNEYEEAEKKLLNLSIMSKDFEPDKVNFYLAEACFYQNKYSASIKHYNLVKTDNADILRQTILGKAYSYFNSKDFANAIFYFNDFLTRYKSAKDVNEIKLRLADCYFGQKNFSKAAAIYKELFDHSSLEMDNDLAFYQYGQSLFKAGKSKDAKDAFSNLQTKFPKSQYVDEAQYVIGWIDFQQSNFSSAINNYKDLVNRFPKSNLAPIAMYSIGDCYFNKGDYDSSIVYYSRVLQDYPSTQYIFDAVNGIQYAYVAKEQPQNAISFIDNFILSNPNSKFADQIFFKKGDIFYSIEDYNQAATSYSDFVSKYPKSALISNAYFWIGKCFANLKRDEEAISNFIIAQQKSPKSDIGISSTIEMVSLYNSKQQFDNALLALNNAIEVNPTSNRVPELLFLKGKNEIGLKKIDDAVSTFDQIIQYYEGTIFASKAKLEIGKVEMSRKNYDKALQYLSQVAEKYLDDIGAEAQYNIGLLSFAQAKYPDAITSFVRVRSVYSAYDEWYTKALIKLGDCFVKLKDKKQAREMYKAVLQRHQNDEYSEEVTKKMRGL